MSPQVSMSSRAWAELLALSLIWGASFLSMRIALDEIGPLTTIAHRVFWGALLLWAVVILRRGTLPQSPRIWGVFLVMGVLNNVIPFGLMAWAMQHIETGLTSILNGATAFFAVLVAAAVFADERLSLRKLAGVGLGMAGVALAVGPDALASLDLRSLAQLGVLAGALSYAVAGAWARATLRGLPPITAAAGMLTGSSLILVPLAAWVEGAPTLALEASTWAAIGYVSAVATAGAYLLYYRVLGMVGAGNLALVTLLIPPIAVTLGALVRAEALAPHALGGLGLIALGMAVLDGRILKRRD